MINNEITGEMYESTFALFLELNRSRSSTMFDSAAGYFVRIQPCLILIFDIKSSLRESAAEKPTIGT